MARFRRRRRKASNRGKINELAYKLKNTVANLSRRCKVDSKSAREYAAPILTAIERGPGLSSCVYCGATLTIANVSFDHILPISRGGSLWTPNITTCCFQCNKTKGSLTAEEYRALLDLLATWEEVARLNVCRRLRLGGSFFGRFKRRK